MHGTLLERPECKVLLISLVDRICEADVELPVAECRNDIAARERAQAQIDARSMRMQTFEQGRQTEAEQRLRRTDRERPLLGGNAVLKAFDLPFKNAKND